MDFSHIDSEGKARMVDVSGKPVVRRYAEAAGTILVGNRVIEALKERSLKKGNPLAAARIAGVMGAKKTGDLIPLCHPLPVDHVSVEFEVKTDSIEIKSTAVTTARTGVEMEDGFQLDADLVISAIGFVPNTKLAKESGLELNQNQAIRIDNYLRTSKDDIYAVGDCSGTHGFITGRTDNIMLASTATAKARVLGYNLFNIKLLRNFYGTLSVFSTEIQGKAFASAGAIEQTAREADVSFVTGKFKTMDRHPGTIKDASEIEVKLIVSPGNGEIIGGELCGGKSVGEMINIIALAIQKAVTVYELVSFQIGTHPLLTSAPTKYPLIKAAEDAIKKIESS